jgi:hypothetical protein
VALAAVAEDPGMRKSLMDKSAKAILGILFIRVTENGILDDRADRFEPVSILCFSSFETTLKIV